MTNSEKAIITFQARVRDFIKMYQTLKKENEDLYAMIGDYEKEIAALKSEFQQAQREQETLKLAKMMSITTEDLEKAKERVAKQIRDINKAIAILSDEK